MHFAPPLTDGGGVQGGGVTVGGSRSRRGGQVRQNIGHGRHDLHEGAAARTVLADHVADQHAWTKIKNERREGKTK